MSPERSDHDGFFYHDTLAKDPDQFFSVEVCRQVPEDSIPMIRNFTRCVNKFPRKFHSDDPEFTRHVPSSRQEAQHSAAAYYQFSFRQERGRNFLLSPAAAKITQ